MRTLSSIAFLIAVMVMMTGQMAVAVEAGSPSLEQSTLAPDEFCGKTPPASIPIACPQTRLDVCQCYLTEDNEAAGPPVAEAPRRSCNAPENKAVVQRTLPDFVCVHSPSVEHDLNLERPPR